MKMQVVDSLAPIQGRGRTPKYPWEVILDGQARAITMEGDMNLDSFRSLAKTAGKRFVFLLDTEEIVRVISKERGYLIVAGADGNQRSVDNQDTAPIRVVTRTVSDTVLQIQAVPNISEDEAGTDDVSDEE